MEVYRITLSKWADKLVGSGYPARWNSKGKFMVYAASSRALATLENLVHRSGEGLNKNFKVIIINIPKELKVKSIRQSTLDSNWTRFNRVSETRLIGDQWLEDNSSAVMKVPSAIIPDESNYLLNPAHPDFQKISIVKREPFVFDSRLANQT
jgi:RES domain-containing protein